MLDRRFVTMCSAMAAPALLFAAVLAFAAAPPAAAAPAGGGAEISPSVMLIGKFDWQVEPDPAGRPWSRCLDQLWRAAERSDASSINFTPTHHWLPPGGGGGGGGSGGGRGRGSVGRYCMMVGDDGRHTCAPWTAALVAEFRDGMRLCFAEALRLGLTIAVRPHLDDGTGGGAWRNGLVFRPSEKHSGLSYADVMLAPLADALRLALDDTASARPAGAAPPLIYLAMQGEMSATVMRYPADWAALAAPLRARVGPRADARIGVGLNFNRLDDTSSTAQDYGSSRASWLLWSLGATDGLAGSGRGGAARAPAIDAKAVKRLLEGGEISFVGVSAYAPLTGPGFELSELENAAFMLADEFRALGVDLRGLINAGRLDLHYSEIGLGGGSRYSGDSPASSPGEVALRPFFGVYGPYSPTRDPWRRPANRDFRREYFSKLARWAADPKNKTYRVGRIYVWSLASWDVFGVYPESTAAPGGGANGGGGGSYHDPSVSRLLRAHNAAVRGGGAGEPAVAAAAAP